MATPSPSGTKAVVFIALLLGGGLLLWFVRSGPSLVDPEAKALFDTSVTRAAAHPVILDTLGGNVERSAFHNFKISGSGLTGTGIFTAKLKGSKMEAELRIVLSKRGGIWAHDLTEVSIPGQRTPLLSLHGPDGSTTSVHRDGVSVTIVPGSGQTWSWTEGTEKWVLTSDGTLMMADQANPSRTLTVLQEQLHRGAGLGDEEAQEKVRRARARLAEAQVLGQSVP